MIPRKGHIRALSRLLEDFPVVAILGARQVGKTTLARQLLSRWKGPGTYLDLEDTADRARLADPRLALGRLRGLVILDEVQQHPGLFETLRVLADRSPRPARFLVLGSASPDLLRQSSESLAGRIVYHELPGLRMDEVGPSRMEDLWFRGGFPASFVARTGRTSREWRRGFIRTFLERDLAQLGFTLPPDTLRRFWNMLAHYHGQVWNSSELARAFGVSDKTVRSYLDLLCGVFMVRQLQPWSENLGKRQVRAPKVYLTDSGLLHELLGIGDLGELEGHPKVGASWEGFALTEVIGAMGARPEECHFWATHGGAELDLLVIRGRTRFGFEFKRTVSPTITHSMRIAMEDLKLTRLRVIHAGEESFPLTRDIDAVPLRGVWDELGRHRR